MSHWREGVFAKCLWVWENGLEQPLWAKPTKEPLLTVSAVLHQVPDTKFEFQQAILPSPPLQSQLSGQFYLLISITVSLGLSIKLKGKGNGIYIV